MAATPESGLRSTQSGVRATPRSEHWDGMDLGKLPVRVFTPEELGRKRVVVTGDMGSHHLFLTDAGFRLAVK